MTATRASASAKLPAGASRATGAAAWVPAARTAPSSASSTAIVPAAGVSRGRSASAEVRSAIAVLAGRGEDADTFADLAARLELDGHQVTVVTDGARRTPAIVETRVPGVPFVLLGSDTGALAALGMVGSPAVRPDALILLGLPLLHVPVAGLPIEEPSPRTLPDLPILLVHGTDDEISPLPLVRMTTRTAPRAELGVIPGGHDLLAGPGRRSVAARVVLFLESLRDGRTGPAA